MASRGNDALMGDEAAKNAFTVGDGVLAELKRVVHTRLPSLRVCARATIVPLRVKATISVILPFSHYLPAIAWLRPRLSRGTFRCHCGSIVDSRWLAVETKWQFNTIIAYCPNVLWQSHRARKIVKSRLDCTEACR